MYSRVSELSDGTGNKVIRVVENRKVKGHRTKIRSFDLCEAAVR